MTSIVALFAVFACTSAMDADDKSWEKPITKVIKLLRDMDTQLNKEADEDAEMYEKMGCWCITNDKEKTKAIADAKKHIEMLTAAIEGGTSKVSQLETELEKLGKEIAKQTDVLSQATAIREKENAEFLADQKDMAASQASLAGAVDALGKAHPGAAFSQSSLMQVRAVLKHHMQKHRKIFHESRGPAISLLQESYAPESGAIFGILKQMKEEFETNIATSKTEEDQALTEYNGMKKAKTDQN
jgi:chaperonin cofactor prefoldin